MSITPVLPRAAEAEFGHGLRAAIRVVRDAAPQPQLSEPVSPELALVCPELRERARAALPDRGPDIFALARPRIVPVGAVPDFEGTSEQPPHARGWRQLVAGATAYLAVEAAHVAVAGAAVVGTLAGVITLGTLIAS